MAHTFLFFLKSLHILGVNSINFIHAEAIIILTLWLCKHFWLDYSELWVNTSNTSKGSFSGCLFWTLDKWWETHPSRFLPFSPSSMLINHIIITFLLMVIGCDGWEGCKSISKRLFVANIQPTDPHACQISNELSDQKLIIIIVILTILSNIKWGVRSKLQPT